MPRGEQEHRRHCCLIWWLPASRPNTAEPYHVGGCQEGHYRKLSWPGWSQVVEAKHQQTKAEALRRTQNAIWFQEVVEQAFTEENQKVDIIQERLTSQFINTLRPTRNEQHFAHGIFKRIFFNENVWISIQISLKFVPKGPVYIPTLVQIMNEWRLVYRHIYASLGLNELMAWETKPSEGTSACGSRRLWRMLWHWLSLQWAPLRWRTLNVLRSLWRWVL